MLSRLTLARAGVRGTLRATRRATAYAAATAVAAAAAASSGAGIGPATAASSSLCAEWRTGKTSAKSLAGAIRRACVLVLGTSSPTLEV